METGVEISYTLANGQKVRVAVSEEVAVFLELDDRRIRAQGRQDRRNLDRRGYVDGETEQRLKGLCDEVSSTAVVNERNALLYRAIANLPEKQRRMARAYYFEDLTLNEVAEREGIRKAAVCRLLKRARHSLLRQLENEPLFAECKLFDELCPLI